MRILHEAAEVRAAKTHPLPFALPKPDVSNRTRKKKQRLQSIYQLASFILYGMLILSLIPFFSSAIFSIAPYIRAIAVLIVPIVTLLAKHALYSTDAFLTAKEIFNLTLLFSGLGVSFLGLMLLYILPFSGPASPSILLLLPIAFTGIFSFLFFKRSPRDPIAQACEAIDGYQKNSSLPALELALDAVIMAMIQHDGGYKIDLIAGWVKTAKGKAGIDQFLQDIMYLRAVRVQIVNEQVVLPGEVAKVDAIFQQVRKASEPTLSKADRLYREVENYKKGLTQLMPVLERAIPFMRHDYEKYRRADEKAAAGENQFLRDLRHLECVYARQDAFISRIDVGKADTILWQLKEKIAQRKQAALHIDPAQTEEKSGPKLWQKIYPFFRAGSLLCLLALTVLFTLSSFLPFSSFHVFPPLLRIALSITGISSLLIFALFFAQEKWIVRQEIIALERKSAATAAIHTVAAEHVSIAQRLSLPVMTSSSDICKEDEEKEDEMPALVHSDAVVTDDKVGEQALAGLCTATNALLQDSAAARADDTVHFSICKSG